MKPTLTESTKPAHADALRVGPPGGGASLQIAARARARLQQSPYPLIRVLECGFHEGVLTLRGRLPTFYMKQLAQTCVRDVPGVEEVNNRICVG